MPNFTDKIVLRKNGIDTFYEIANFIKGYLNTTNNKFYKESTFLTEIEGKDRKVYLDLNTNYLYKFNTDSLTPGFVQIGGGGSGGSYTAGNGINISNTDEISAKVDDTSITIDTNDALKVANTYKTIFVGTRAQWDVLSTADKIKYNEAHITDDVIGGEVADVVQNGLMSPVTSNAVADELKISSYPLSSVTLSNITEGRATDDYIHMEKTGNMFRVILDGVIFTNATAGTTIISNLPHPSSGSTYGKYGFLLDNVGTAFALLQVLPNGTLKVYGQKAANQQYWGEITYFID